MINAPKRDARWIPTWLDAETAERVRESWEGKVAEDLKRSEELGARLLFELASEAA